MCGQMEDYRYYTSCSLIIIHNIIQYTQCCSRRFGEGFPFVFLPRRLTRGNAIYKYIYNIILTSSTAVEQCSTSCIYIYEHHNTYINYTGRTAAIKAFSNNWHSPARSTRRASPFPFSAKLFSRPIRFDLARFARKYSLVYDVYSSLPIKYIFIQLRHVLLVVR